MKKVCLHFSLFYDLVKVTMFLEIRFAVGNINVLHQPSYYLTLETLNMLWCIAKNIVQKIHLIFDLLKL